VRLVGGHGLVVVCEAVDPTKHSCHSGGIKSLVVEFIRREA
jgi:hypothetical protein